MKNFKIKIGVLALAISLGTLTSCEQENDELLLNDEVSSVKEQAGELIANKCDTNTFAPIDGPSNDYHDAVNKKIDDRSCKYDYKQSKYGSSSNWGGYRLTNDDNTSGLQTRIERSTKSIKYGNNKFVQLKGTVRVLNAGSVTDSFNDTDMRDNDGTYIAQVKGRHDKIQGNESKDPAIVLFVAKPKRRDGGKGSIIKEGGKVKEFKIFAEQVKKRGGSGSSGRKLVYITTVKRNRDFGVDIKTRFETEDNNKIQYVEYTINGVSKSFAVSRQNTAGQLTNPVEMRIRMGAYRCKGGTAEILWKDNLSVSSN